MSSDVELRKIANELDKLNKNLFHIHRTMKDIAISLGNGNKPGQDMIPKMVEEVAKVMPEIPKQRQGSAYDAMKAALEEDKSHKRYQEPKE